MQTALAVRETVTKVLDVFVYVVVYFGGTLLLIGQADLWMTVPLLVWLAAYVGILAYFIPRLQAVSSAQADARAQMTGRIVDSYTNIQTVKLFAHTLREQDYARDAMDEFMVTVHRQMRLVTQLTVSLHVVNSLLLAVGRRHGDPRLAAGHRHASARSPSPSRLVMRIRAMSQWILWEVADLFENVGTVAGRHRHDLAAARRSPIAPAPRRSSFRAARSASTMSASTTAAQTGVIEDFSLDHPARREGRPRRPLRRRQVDARQPAAALLRPRRRARS